MEEETRSFGMQVNQFYQKNPLDLCFFEGVPLPQ